ncbi:MAG: hypothetical protein KDD36_09400 [Flavobacteriales bacterium]|nr:hypothetical protein [Flavobacteriales bacterium]
MSNVDFGKKEFDSGDLLHFLSRWFRPLFIISIAAALLSSVASFLIDEKYSSTVILFPVSTNSISKALLSTQTGSKTDILEFGEEEQAEQLLQILHSDEIRDRIIEKYDLIHHYDIDTSSRFPKTALFEEFENNITFERTEFMSVRIEVLDKEPELAARIANDIAALSDSVRHRMHRERAIKALRIVEQEYDQKVKEVHALEDSLTTLRRWGVYDYHVQTEVLTEQRAQALIKGNQNVAREIDRTFELLAKYGAASVAITDQLHKEYNRLAELKERYEETKVDVQEELPFKFVVDRAVASEKKKYPIRWLIVAVSTFSAFLLSILTIAILEKWRSIRMQSGSNKL